MEKYVRFVNRNFQKYILLTIMVVGIIAISNGQTRTRISPLKTAFEVVTEEEVLKPKVFEIRSEISPNIGDGNFKYYVETSDGLHAEQLGYLNRPGQSQVHEGSYTTFDEDGKIVTINYVADKNGFKPSADSLPTSPPIPAELLQAREDILNQQNAIRQSHLAHFRAAHAVHTANANGK